MIMHRVSLTGFFDEMEKIASGRSLVKDFAGGLDPSGAYTFDYGIEDADADKGEAALRRAVGTVGGVAGGVVLIPAVISGLIGGAKGISSKGLRGALPGFVQGAHAPFTKIRDAVLGSKALTKLDRGAELSKAESGQLLSMGSKLPEKYQIYLRGLVGDKKALKGIHNTMEGAVISGTDAYSAHLKSTIPSQISKAVDARVIRNRDRITDTLSQHLPEPVALKATQKMNEMAEHVSRMVKAKMPYKQIDAFVDESSELIKRDLLSNISAPEALSSVFLNKVKEHDMLGMLQKATKTQLSQGLSTLGISGLISGGSAYLQYGKGRQTGKLIPKELRHG